MDKKELANILGELLGVAKMEQKIAMEAVIQKVADFLSVGQTIKIPSIGIFRLIKSSVEEKKISNGSNKSAYQLLFASSVNQKGKTDFIPFTVSPKNLDVSGSIDEAFSISLGKPLIILSDNFSNEYLNYDSYLLHNKNIEEKIIEIINSGTILEDFRIDYKNNLPDEIILDSIQDTAEDFIPEVPETKLPSVPWDFGIISGQEGNLEENSSADIIPDNEKQPGLKDNIFLKNTFGESSKKDADNISDLNLTSENQPDHSILSIYENNISSNKLDEQKESMNAVTNEQIDKNISRNSDNLSQRPSGINKDHKIMSEKKSNFWLWITALIIIIIIGLGAYYVIFYKLNKSNVNTIQNEKKTKSKQTQLIDTTKKADSSNSDIKLTSELIRNDNKTKMIKEYLYTDGSRFTVQISSWKTRSVAENEAEKLRKKGYDAYITIKNPNSSNQFYCLRIGDFTSLEEAEQYYKKLK
jgi:cell division protein FtsN/nucleoid DNA-binding protein